MLLLVSLGSQRFSSVLPGKSHKNSSSTDAGGEEQEEKNVVLGIRRSKRRCQCQLSPYKGKFQVGHKPWCSKQCWQHFLLKRLSAKNGQFFRVQPNAVGSRDGGGACSFADAESQFPYHNSQ